MSEQGTIERLLRAGVLNGESPLWDGRIGRLWWVDVRGAALHQFDPVTGQDAVWEMPCWLGACYLTNAGVAVTLRGGLYLFDATDGSLEFAAGPPFNARQFTFNDGRCDRGGRLFAGTMTVPLAPQNPGLPERQPLFRYDGGGQWMPVTDPVRTSNALAWSPDARVMYHADTRQKTVWAYDYDHSSGAVANKRVFVTVDIPGASGPDGACIDRDGFFWVAVFGGSCVLRFDPTGKLERRIEMPCRYPTMPAFGGPGLETLYVTSANHPLPDAERKAKPEEGNLFRMEAPVGGLAEAVFRGR
jgi:sugar lactone lactonase YvrE